MSMETDQVRGPARLYKVLSRFHFALADGGYLFMGKVEMLLTHASEELQSSNEELETMNEELQSTNEELQALNEELRERTVEANDMNAFLRSVFAGMRAGLVVVDQQLNVLVWNYRAEDLWGLREEEVKGHSFTPFLNGQGERRGVVLFMEEVEG